MSDLVSPDDLPHGVNLTSFVIDQDEMKMFPEIWSRLSQNGTQSLSLGCSLVFDDTFVRTVLPYGDDFKSKTSGTVCSPLFSSVKTFIWRVYLREDIYYFGRYSTGVDKEFYDYLFQVMLTREVFLKEFPDKQVIIEVRSRHIHGWTPTYYKAPFALDFTG